VRKLSDYRLGLFASKEYLARRGPIPPLANSRAIA